MSKKKNIVLIGGARPNFVKLAALIPSFAQQKKFNSILVHTGQHYDYVLSKIFFDGLNLPVPTYHLGVGSGSQAWQTSKAMLGIEKVFEQCRADLVVVVGDVNSTVAAALVGSKLGIPVAHIEAGLRSYDRRMPEEINRVVTDHLSEYLFLSCPDVQKNLDKEGMDRKKCFFVGNVMIDTLEKYRKEAARRKTAERIGFVPQAYGLVTLHRPENVENKARLQKIAGAFGEVSKELPLVFPCHPRTRKRLSQHKIKLGKRICLVQPVGYLDFLSLEMEARVVLTDSGGVQEETTALNVPCITVRENTERPITVSKGTNFVAGVDKKLILQEVKRTARKKNIRVKTIRFWDGKAAGRIVRILAAKI